MMRLLLLIDCSILLLLSTSCSRTSTFTLLNVSQYGDGYMYKMKRLERPRVVVRFYSPSECGCVSEGDTLRLIKDSTSVNDFLINKL